IGHYNYNLETTTLLPKDSAIIYDTMRAANVVPYIDGKEIPTIDVMRSISASGGENHLNVVYPYEKGSTGVTTQELQTGNANVVMYKIVDPKGVSATVVCNNSKSVENIALNGYIDMETAETFDGVLQPGTMRILSDQGASKPKTVEIFGSGIVKKPGANGKSTYSYRADLLDQNNNKMTGLNKGIELSYYPLPVD
ncbi:MAG: hypothetical protein RSC29_00490, partial [Oscillospiraceae bacterium]